jgi:hypothetical protein
VWQVKIVNLRSLRFLILFCLFIQPFFAFAGDFDGLKPLSGSVDKILEIYPTRISNDADSETVGLPQNFLIDFKAKIVRPSKGSLIRRTSKIKRVEHLENKLILQGIEDGVENVDDGLAWSMAISKKTGKVVLSASGDGVAYVVFGTCSAVENILE